MIRSGRAVLVSLALIAGLALLVGLFWDQIVYLWHFLGNMEVRSIAERIRASGLWAPLLSILFMIAQAIIAPIPSILISAANGLLFGPFWGSVLSWVGGVAGALIAFGIGRGISIGTIHRLIRDSNFEQYVEKLSGVGGFRIVLVARLLPFISFDAVSFAAGITYMRFTPFLIATGLGMIPGTVAYVLLGHFVGGIEGYTPYIIAGSLSLVLVLVGIWVVKAVAGKTNG